MPRTYQRKYLPDGSPNPRWKPRGGANARRGSRGKHLTKFTRGEFIAWDGEGVTIREGPRAGEHVYTMLVASRGDGRASWHIVNPDGLSTWDCLDLLTRVAAEHPKAVHVAYGASYDVNMMLGALSRAQAQALKNGDRVTVGSGERAFRVQYRARKSFSVKRSRWHVERGALKRKDTGLILWDVLGFFQGTFVKTIESYLGKDYPALPMIRENKAKRHEFDASPDGIATTLRYCLAECDALVRIMETLREYMREANLTVARWDGAGACAAALLRREAIEPHKGESPAAVRRAAQFAYAGGRMEVVCYGDTRARPIYHYDINSAYPTAMCELPSLADATWEHRTHADRRGRPLYDAAWSYDHDRPFSLYRVRWDLRGERETYLYPFFWRSSTGSIYYPAVGEGWYWGPELAEALRALDAGDVQANPRRNAHVRGGIQVMESWHCTPATDEKPFAWIPPLYAQRLAWKNANVGAEKVIKLAINSLYGKTAQSAGWKKPGDNIPRFHVIEWAGWVTSYTRARLYGAVRHLAHGAAPRVLMLSTDAVYTLDPLPALPVGKGLGEWSPEPHIGLTIAQSGVYWTDSLNARGEFETKIFCRGFDRESLPREKVVETWGAGGRMFQAQVTRFVTLGSALAKRREEDFHATWRRWKEDAPRELQLTMDGTKRADMPARFDARRGPARGMVPTRPAEPAALVSGPALSFAYALPWVTVGREPEYPAETIDGAPAREVEAEIAESGL